MLSEYKLNNPMNIAVITVRVVFVLEQWGEPNYGERVGCEASGVWGRNPQWGQGQGKVSGHGGFASLKLTTFSHLKDTLNNKNCSII